MTKNCVYNYLLLTSLRVVGEMGLEEEKKVLGDTSRWGAITTNCKTGILLPHCSAGVIFWLSCWALKDVSEVLFVSFPAPSHQPMLGCLQLCNSSMSCFFHCHTLNNQLSWYVDTYSLFLFFSLFWQWSVEIALFFFIWNWQSVLFSCHKQEKRCL